MKNRPWNVCVSQLQHMWRRALPPTARRTHLSVALFVLALLVAFGAVLAPQANAAGTITVNTTTDENGTGANCSLREAITAANTDAAYGGCPAGSGVDTIVVPAGTYTLTLANAGGANEDNNATGDLDILDSLTIQGSGSGSTIIQAGTTTTNGIDKVFALNPICTSAINVTIDGVTVRFGRNSQPSGAPDVSFTGGGIDWCAAGSGGTFNLSNAVVSDNTNVNGYGGGLNVDTVSSPTTVNISNVTFANNQTLSTTQTANGGAINLFGDQPTITITNSTFTGNHTTNATSGGGAIFFRPTTVGSLSISGSTFTSNTAAGIGGAIATDSHGAGTTISIQTSTFSGNTATNSFGGALDLDGTNLNTTPFSLSHLKMTGNTAGISGGGIFVGKSNVTMDKSLIVGNSAPTGKGLHKSVDVATATVSNNWWGCSTGPGAAPCDTATTAGGTLTFSPWYRDQLTASTSPLVTNQSSALTASFLTNSANTAVPVADLAEIIGRSVMWAATNGNLSGTQGTIQAAGTATGSFQASAAGTAIISAKVDNDNTSPVSPNVLSLTVNRADTVAAITNGASLSGTPSVTGQPVAVSYSVTGAFGNSPTAPTGNVTVSDGTDSCTGSVAAGSCLITFRTAGSKTIMATYAGDGNFNASPASAGVGHLVNKADTTTTITSDTPAPSVVGEAVTFNVAVAPVAPGAVVAPTTIGGTVNVSDGGSHSCTVTTLTTGVGSCTITFTAPGLYSFTATYGGDSNFNPSLASASVAHTVNKASTTTTITSDTPDPSVVGGSVTFNYAVAVVAPGAGAPTGNVTVTDGTNTCTGTVAAGSCVIAFTAPGLYSFTATYGGDTNFNSSTSASASHTVNKADTTTSIISDNPDPSAVGESVTVAFSVTVTAPGAGTPTGNVTISDGTDSCIGTVAAGSCDITLTSAGLKTLTATYAGDTNFNGSASAGTPHTVNKASTTTAITSDLPDPSIVGQSVTVNFNVAVTAPGAGTPTGNVTISDGTDSCIGTVAVGQCTITFTSAGAKSLTATYAGDGNFNSSTSAIEAHQVDKADTTTTIISDNPDPSDPNQTVTVNFTVVAVAPGAGTPTGNVTVSDGVDSCTGTVGAGTCSLILSTPGARTLIATYSGDGNFNGSISTGEPHTVNQFTTTTTITADTPDPSVVGEAVTVQYSIAPTVGSGTPTGNVTISDGVDSCIGTVAAGQCTITFTSAGNKTLAASYAGDASFSGSTSAGVAHAVNKADTTTTISADNPDPSLVGQAVTVNFTVVAVAPGAGTPTGNVTVSDGVDGCTGTVASGSCSIALTTLGNRTLIATYAGDANFNGSTSAGDAHSVVAPDLTLTKSHSGNFTQGDVGDIYTITVTNSGDGPTNGTVTVVDSLPSGLTATAMSGTGWTCTLGTLTCTRSDALASGSSYEDITLTVDVANNAPPSVTNSADVSGGGEVVTGNDTANDITTIVRPGTTIVSISRSATNPTNSSSVDWTVVFANPLSGLTASNFSLLSSGLGGAPAITAVSPVGGAPATSWTITASTGSGDGTLGLNLVNDTGLDHSLSNLTFTGEVYTIDRTAPTLTIDQAAGQADPTGTAPINFTAVFNEPVTGFDNADVSLSGTAGPTSAVVTEIAPMDGTTYNVAVSGMTLSGTVIASIPASAAQDAATNASSASTSTDNTITFDPVVPVATGIVRADPSPTTATSVRFVVTFSKSVSGVDATDFTFTASGVAGAAITNITGGGTTWTVTVSTGTGDGTLRMDLVDDDTIVDAAGNQLGGKGAGNGSFTAGEVYTIDKTPPSVISVVRANASPTNAATVDFTVTFGESVTGVDATDFSLATSGVSGAAIVNIAGSGTTWTATVNTGSGSGTIGLNVIDDDTIVDVLGNPLGGAGAGNGGFTTGDIYTIDKTAPQAGGLAAADITTGGGSTQTFTIVFSDNLAINIASLDGSDIRVTGPGGFNQVAALVSVTPATNGTPRTATYQISAPGGTWDTADNGAYMVELQANQVSDTAGNPAAASVLGTFSVHASAGQRTVYLPLIFQSVAQAPDLVVTSVTLSPSKTSFTTGEQVQISVVIKNQGNLPTTPFWVDLYLNPARTPALNLIWSQVCGLKPCYGIAWQIAQPLAPGAELTLTSTVGSYAQNYTNWRGRLAAGTTDLYVQADSWNPGKTIGASGDSNLSNNLFHISDLSVTGQNTASTEPTVALPERPAAGQR